MKTTEDIKDRVTNIFDSIDAIETVKVSPFFKDKTMQRLFNDKEETISFWNWFTPKLQLATLVCFLILNVIAFSQLNTSTYDENVNQLAESYGLSTSSETSLLNQI